jgi:acyl carrier protein
MAENPYQAPNCGEPATSWSGVLAVLGLVAIAATYFSVVGPMVLSGRLDRAWAVAPAFIGAVFVLVYCFEPNLCAQRCYERQLKEREGVDDQDLLESYFSTEEMDPDIPGRVRGILAKQMGCTPEKMLPDDDLTFFWDDVDGIDLILELEDQFGMKINETDAERTAYTIREISRLVHRLRPAANMMSHTDY